MPNPDSTEADAPRARTIPIRAVAHEDSACSGAESFALMVLGDSMQPEFAHGDIVIVEPDGLAQDGAFVLAQVSGEWMLRQLLRATDGWRLVTLSDAQDDIALADLACVRGVIIQRSRPGRRRATKRYFE